MNFVKMTFECYFLFVTENKRLMKRISFPMYQYDTNVYLKKKNGESVYTENPKFTSIKNGQ